MRPLGPKTNAPANVSLTLTSKKNQLILWRDGREVARQLVSPALEWRSDLSGVLQRSENSDGQSNVTSVSIR